MTLSAGLLLGGALTGCAGISQLPGHHVARTCAPTADGPAAPAAQVRVVCEWASALEAGHVDAAAGFFHLPSLFYDGTGLLTLDTRAQAEVANSGLTCGAVPVSAFRQGRYVNVLFRLTGRPGAGGTACSGGVGQSARTRFLIRDGRIVAWLRAPVTTPSPASGGGSAGKTI